MFYFNIFIHTDEQLLICNVDCLRISMFNIHRFMCYEN